MRDVSGEELSLADGLILQAFMLQMSLELGREKPDPVSWARGFVDELIMRLDGTGYVDPVREAVIARIEKLDRSLLCTLAGEAQLIRD
jgi:hypothetical protein